MVRTYLTTPSLARCLYKTPFFSFLGILQRLAVHLGRTSSDLQKEEEKE